MLFNSWVFAIYLPVILLCYYDMRRRWQNVFLVGAGYFFYGWRDYRFRGLLAISTVVALGSCHVS